MKYLMEESVPGKVDEKATQLHAIASLKVLLDATKPQRGAATSSAANHVKVNLKETSLGRPNGNIDATLDSVSHKSAGMTLAYCVCIGILIKTAMNFHSVRPHRSPTKTSLKLSVWRGRQGRRTASHTCWWHQSSFHYG